MAQGADEEHILALLDRGESQAALDLAARGFAAEPDSTFRRWAYANVCGLVGRPDEGLAHALALRDTEAWQHVSPQVWDLALWAGRFDIGVELTSAWLAVVEAREDIAALPFEWGSLARAHLTHSWALGRVHEATTRLWSHAELDDSGWRLEGSDARVVGPAQAAVRLVLEPGVAALEGRFVDSPEWNDEYRRFLAALFGLAAMSPADAWNTLDRLEAERGGLAGVGAAYRAQIAYRAGQVETGDAWLDSWFAEPLFPLAVSNLLVVGLVPFFLGVRDRWAAPARS